ncbi:MAG: retron St85 family RNA-directed DNA polymerase [Terriglobia bacterium]|jgi:RNA-directed DNA polymerase
MSKTSATMQLLGFPTFSTIEELSELIRIEASRLSILALRLERFYRTYRIRKQRGGWRQIHSPSHELKAVQAWILRNILDKLSTSSYATAYVKGRRLLDNVSPHVSNRYFLSVDVRNFFPSVGSLRVRRLFEALGYSRLASHKLRRLCSYFSGLPQGAVTSPALSNLICLRLDRRLAGLCSRRNIVFTRYADDITFSTNNRNALPRLLPTVYRILREEGFEPNQEKTRILGPRTQCLITGLVKNSSVPTFGIGKKKKTTMRAIMHNFLAHGTSHPDYPSEASIEGWLEFLRNVDPASRDQMVRYWTALKSKYPKLANEG